MESAAYASRTRRLLIAIAAVAFLARLAFIFVRDRPPFSDEVDYDRLGWTLATTGSYSDGGTATGYRPIGYPAFVGAIYALVGQRPWVVHVVQAALDTVSAILLFFVAGGGRAGLWAAGIWSLYPPAVLYTDLLMPETLFTTALLSAVLLFRRHASAPWRESLALGAVLGVLGLLKASAVLLLAALPLAARIERLRLARFGLVALGALLVFGPWVVRNWIVLGYPSPATSTGANLIIGNNPNASGGYSPRVPSDMLPDAGDERARDTALIASGARYAAAHPIQFLENGVRKLAHLFGSEGGMIVWAFSKSPADPSTRLREKYRSLPLWLHLAVSGPYALVLLIGSLGFLSYPRGEVRAFFLALLGTWLVVHFVFYGGGRYHFPLMPFFVLLAAWRLFGPRAGRRPLGTAKVAVISVVWACLLGVWAGEVLTVVGRGHP